MNRFRTGGNIIIIKLALVVRRNRIQYNNIHTSCFAFIFFIFFIHFLIKNVFSFFFFYSFFNFFAFCFHIHYIIYLYIRVFFVFNVPQQAYKCEIFLIKGVTILLSLTVFLNMVAETMPATSDAVPLLGNARPTANVILLSHTIYVTHSVQHVYYHNNVHKINVIDIIL